ncbi:MAG: hypothetical protein K8S14_02300 [Actinomycetia bacterium]|nr:hypothetical protein [Actinomycetes bacterium]
MSKYTWSGWASLGRPKAYLRDGLIVGNNQDGRLEVFATGRDGALWHIYQPKPNKGPWPGWSSLGKPTSISVLDNPVIFNNQDGRLEVFVTGYTGGATTYMGGDLWHISQSKPSKGPWTGWENLGSPSKSVKINKLGVGRNSDGRLEIFAAGADGGSSSKEGIWHIWQQKPNKGTWSKWASLSKPKGVNTLNNQLVAVGHNSDGRLEIFVTRSSLWHMYQSKPSRGPWIGWGKMGNPANTSLNRIPVAVGQNSDGRLEVFAVDYWNGADNSKGSLWHRYQPKPSRGPWINWGSLGRPGNVPLVHQPIVECDSNGCLVVFATNIEASIWYKYQTEPKKGPWSSWYNLGKLPNISISNIHAVGKNKDGRLEVFVQGAASGKNSVLWHNRQN